MTPNHHHHNLLFPKVNGEGGLGRKVENQNKPKTMEERRSYLEAQKVTVTMFDEWKKQNENKTRGEREREKKRE